MSRLSFAGRRSCCTVALMALALLAPPGCGDETGIVIEVSRDSEVTSLETLEFHIGVAGELDSLVTALSECNTDDGSASYYVQTATDAERVVPLAGQDIANDPYRLLLRPGDVAQGTDLMVLVVGKQSDGGAVGLAQLEDPVSFVEGRALRWDLVLSRPNGGYAAENGCICGPAGAIVSPDDPDCDGAVGDQDCAPNNGFVGPDEREKCDGIADTDCNPDTLARSVECYGRIDDQGDDLCFYGTRACNDRPGDLFGPCMPKPGVENEVDSVLCDRFLECGPSSDQFECANRFDGDAFRKVQCELLVTGNGELCPGRSVFLAPKGVIADSQCDWSLLGGRAQDPFNVHLAGFPPVQPVATIDICEPIFRVEGLRGPASNLAPEGDVTLFFELEEPSRFEIWQMEIQVEMVDQCPADSVREPGLDCDDLENLPTAETGER